MKIAIKLAVLACMLLAAVPSFAACTGSSPTWSSTADQASVTTCISNASSGDIINVSSGSATWSTITITKAIHLMGAGTGSTVITQTGSLAYIPILADVDKVFELAGFTFQGNVTHLDETGWGKTPPITGLKVHNNAFNGSTTVRAIWLGGLEFGVFYNNTFSGNFIAVSVIGAAMAGNFYPLCFGCASYPYFEDNTFGQGAGAEFITETGQGGRMVLRHNTINGYDPGGGSELFDVHGEQNSGGWTATSEYYHNTTAGAGVGTTPFRWMHLRGGQALVMNNTINRNISFNVTEYQAVGQNGICHNYPVAYNNAEVYCNPISGTCKETQVNNSFFFNNIVGGLQQTPTYTFGNGGSCGADPPWGDNTFVQQNREFWLPTFGLESALPATCTANGNTYYGTTDSDKIFKCTSTNTWTNTYTPYTYPHPLRSAQVAASCSRANVGAAVAAANYGDTVSVPAGNCTWATTLTITKGITLTGAGSGQTTITSGTIGGWMLIYQPDATSVSTNARFEVSGFTFDMANTGDAGIWVNNTSATPISNVLIHDNIFKNMNAGNTSLDPACLRTGENGDVYGVAYLNTFQDCKIVGENYGNYQTSWNNTTYTYGGSNNFYWEDNIMTGNDAFHYAGHGGRYATRFNAYTFTSGTFEVVWDMHGNQPSGVYGTMGCEHYKNTVSLAGGTTVIDHRGGMCMFFSNTVTGTAGQWQIREEYDDSIDPTTNPEPQHVSNSYYFLNTFNGSDQPLTETQDCCAAIAPNAQYWNYVPSGFNGTVGVGSGTIAARPATCTTGVGYWATDQGSWNTKLAANTSGQFYKCTSTNTWALYYTPLTYPHPLRAGALPTAPIVSLSPISLSFGNQPLQVTSSAQNVTLTNTGTATLSITSITLTGANPGDYAISSNPCGASLGVGLNCIVGVTFRPTVTGSRTANLTFTTNATSSPDNIPLTGTGQAPVSSFSPTSATFNGIKVGLSSSPVAITLTNTGNATMSITSITLTGANPSDYSSNTTCGATLTVSSSCAINVTFSPILQGLRGANISVVSNAVTSPDTVPLAGIGFNPISGTGTLSGTGTIKVQP